MSIKFNENQYYTSNTEAKVTPRNDDNSFTGSIMTVNIPDYVEVEEEIVVEEDLINEFCGDKTINNTKRNEYLNLHILSKYKNIDIEKINQLAEEVLKDNPSFANTTIDELKANECYRLYMSIAMALDGKVNNGEFDYNSVLIAAQKQFREICRNEDYDKQKLETYNTHCEGDFSSYLEEKYPNLSREEAIEKYTQEEIFDVINKRLEAGESKEIILEDIKHKFNLIIDTLKNDDEKIKFFDVIKKSGSGLVTELSEYTSKCLQLENNQIEFAIKATNVDELAEIQKEDITGNFDSTQHGQVIIETLNSEEAAVAVKDANVEATEKFLEENQDKLAEINAKLAKGEELSEEEIKLLAKNSLHQGINAGIYVGINNHRYIKYENKTKYSQDILDVFAKHGNEKEFVEKLAEYLINNQDTLDNINIKEFTERLNSITENKYSQIVEQIESSIESAQKTSSGSLGFENKPEVDKNKLELEKITNTINTNNKEEKITYNVTAKTANETSNVTTNVQKDNFHSYLEKEGNYFKAVYEYIKDNGAKGFFDLLNDNTKNNETPIKNLYKRLNPEKQANLIEDSRIDTVGTLLDWVKNDALEKLRGKKLCCTNATDMLNNKIEERDEKKDKANLKLGI